MLQQDVLFATEVCRTSHLLNCDAMCWQRTEQAIAETVPVKLCIRRHSAIFNSPWYTKLSIFWQHAAFDLLPYSYTVQYTYGDLFRGDILQQFVLPVKSVLSTGGSDSFLHVTCL